MLKGVAEMTADSALSAQLRLIYQQQLNLEPAVTGDRAEASRRELETMLGVGILIYENIRQRHLSWYADVESSRTAYDLQDAQMFADEYHQWLAATEHWLAQLEPLEQQDYEVGSADEIRKRYNEVRLVNLDVHELVSRYEKLERGGGIAAGEFFASMRDREAG